MRNGPRTTLFLRLVAEEQVVHDAHAGADVINVVPRKGPPGAPHGLHSRGAGGGHNSRAKRSRSCCGDIPPAAASLLTHASSEKSLFSRRTM